jgi:hypothetical protein
MVFGSTNEWFNSYIYIHAFLTPSPNWDGSGSKLPAMLSMRTWVWSLGTLVKTWHGCAHLQCSAVTWDAHLQCSAVTWDAHLQCSAVTWDAHLQCSAVAWDAHLKCSAVTWDAHLQCSAVTLDAHLKCSAVAWDAHLQCSAVGGDRWVLGFHWPTSLAKSISCWFSERSYLQRKKYGDQLRKTLVVDLWPTHLHLYTYTNTHTHTHHPSPHTSHTPHSPTHRHTPHTHHTYHTHTNPHTTHTHTTHTTHTHTPHITHTYKPPHHTHTPHPPHMPSPPHIPYHTHTHTHTHDTPHIPPPPHTHTPYLHKGQRTLRKRWWKDWESQRAGRLLWVAVLWAWHGGCAQEPTAAMAACIRPNQSWFQWGWERGAHGDPPLPLAIDGVIFPQWVWLLVDCPCSCRQW